MLIRHYEIPETALPTRHPRPDAGVDVRHDRERRLRPHPHCLDQGPSLRLPGLEPVSGVAAAPVRPAGAGDLSDGAAKNVAVAWTGGRMVPVLSERALHLNRPDSRDGKVTPLFLDRPDADFAVCFHRIDAWFRKSGGILPSGESGRLRC